MIKPNKRRYTIGMYLLSGFTPWGRDLDRALGVERGPCMPLYGGEYLMCCGHVMKPPEVEEWKEAGLLVDGLPDGQGRETVVAGPKLESWISHAWHNMVVQRWWRHGEEEPAPWANETVN